MKLPYFWLRLGKWHVGVMPASPPLFSERYGYTKVYRAFGYMLKIDEATATSATFVGWTHGK